MPVVCFTKPELEKDVNFSKEVLDEILLKGKSWLSVYPIKGIPCFRACITNYNTTEKDIDELIKELNVEFTNYLK